MARRAHKGAWRYKPDRRDWRASGLRRPAAVAPRDTFVWPTPWPPRDQHETPACVGYAWAGWLDAHLGPGHGMDPEDLYRRAQRRDPWPGEDYEGSTARGGAKVLRAIGLVHSFYRADSPAELAEGVLYHGPAVMGTAWYERMSTPRPGRHGRLYAVDEGQPEGGHAWLVIGASTADRWFLLRNSWGTDYPDTFLTWGTMARLLKQEAEAILAVPAD